MATEPADEHVVVDAAKPRPRSNSVPGSLLAGLFLAAFGSLFLYGAVQIWAGVHQAIAGPRIPGIARDVHCPGGHSSCGGTFTSTDGTVRNRHVVVEGVTTSQASVRATLVPRIDTGHVVDSIQSNDTAYVHGVTLSVLGISVIGVVLTGLGLMLSLPLLFVLVAILTGRPWRSRKAAGESRHAAHRP